MINIILKKLLVAAISSLLLFVAGLAIWYFRQESQTSLQDTLFWVGTIPLALGLVSGFSGKGGPIYQISSLKNNQASDERSMQAILDLKSSVASGLNWVLAGLLVWVFALFL